MLGTTETAVKAALQRARASLRSDVGDLHATQHERTDDRLADRFADAFARGDINAVVALLTDDAWLAMPPAPHEYHGPDEIMAFLQVSTSWRADRVMWLVPTWANTQPAFGCYLTEPGGQRGRGVDHRPHVGRQSCQGDHPLPRRTDHGPLRVRGRSHGTESKEWFALSRHRPECTRPVE